MHRCDELILKPLLIYKYEKHMTNLDMNSNGLDWKPSTPGFENIVQINAQNKPHGMLLYIFPTGHILQGVVTDKDVKGHMRQIYPDGTYYEGDWLNGGINGYGTKSIHNKQMSRECFTRQIFP